MKPIIPCLALVLAGAADASVVVRFKFSGTIEQVVGNFPNPPVQVGDPYTIAFEFESTTPDSNPDPNIGGYGGAINLVEGFAGPHIVNYTLGNISVQDNIAFGDLYSAIAADPNATFVTWTLVDFQGLALPNDALPTNLAMNLFDVKRIDFHVDVSLTPAVYWEASGTITSFSVTGAPCYPDCNTDGALTVADFGCFQTAFVSGNMYADCNADGALTVADFGCFQTAFVTGCP